MDTKTKPILEVANVSKTFSTSQGDITILDQVNFVVNKGEKVAIVGPSGSGKSTLLSLIGLLDTPTTGTITVDGEIVNELSEARQAKFRNEKIGFIFQSFELISPFNVTENVMAPLEIGGSLLATDVSEAQNLITSIGLSERSEAMPHTLSGGEKQRVAIARALVRKPALILADEPTGSLDRVTGEKVLSMLLEAVDSQDTTLIIITHDEGVAGKMDRVFELRDKNLHERA
ncbi:MAG: ABC transporter ATP-binding protein [Candidatus Paceibacterota bacterium]